MISSNAKAYLAVTSALGLALAAAPAHAQTIPAEADAPVASNDSIVTALSDARFVLLYGLH